MERAVLKFKKAACIRGDHDAMLRELVELVERKNGMLRPQDVLEVARNPDSALHQHFTWDDTEAAHKRRLDEARALIRAVMWVDPINEEPRREFISVRVPMRDVGGGLVHVRRYVRYETVRQDEDLTVQVLRDCLRDLRAIMRKYELLHEDLRGVRASIELLERRLVVVQ